jgi:hypothetical protein
MTSDAITALVATLVQTGAIDAEGNLTLTTQGGQIINLGSVLSSVPSASTTVAGIIELATTAEITAGTDNTTAVTPEGLAGVTGPMQTSLNGKQASNANLTTIAAIVPANGDVMQYESGAWSHRTPAQLAADLQAAYPLVVAKLYSGSAYGNVTSGTVYVGNVDPGSGAVNGSVWFDTSGS